MSEDRLSDEMLSAFVDGELPPDATAAAARALAADPVLAARAAAFRGDRDRLRAAYAPIAAAPLPAAWLSRIEAAVQPRPAEAVPVLRARPARIVLRPVLAWAIAACLVLAVGIGAWNLRLRPADGLLAQAEAASGGALNATAHFGQAALPGGDAVRVLLAKATGLPVSAPDLRRQGWQLAGIDTYRGAAGLHYVNGQGQTLFVFVRPSTGAPRFDLLKRGQSRICVWQDEVVGAVMMGDMTAGQMMRVAGAAYASLDL